MTTSIQTPEPPLLQFPVSDPWPKAIARVLAHEGGLTDHKSDPGGITNFGISLRFLKSLNLDIDHDGDVDADDIRHLSLDQAKLIYKKEFWDRYNYRLFPENVAIKLLDTSVNMGPSQSHKILQQALWGHGYQVAVDGVLGAQSRSAVDAIFQSNRLATNVLLPTMRVLQHAYYNRLIEKNPKLAAFNGGWTKRAYAC